MKKFTMIMALVLAGIIAFSLIGCGQTNVAEEKKADATVTEKAAAPAATAAPAEKQYLIGLSQESLDHPFMVTQRKQIQDEAKKLSNVKIVCTDGGGNVTKQVSGIEDMLAQKIDLLMVQASKAEGLKQELEKVKTAGVPFMFVGKPIKGTDAVTMVSNDNLSMGKVVGQYIVDYLKKKNGSEKGNIVILEGIPGDQTSEDRIGGALENIKKFPGIKIVAQQPANYRRPEAVSVMQNILQANGAGKIDLVFAANGEMALGVVQAAKDANRLKEFGILGLDGQKEELDSIKAGEMTATWKYKPAGIEGFAAAMKILKGEKVEPNIVIDTEIIDSSNAATAQPSF